VREVISEFLTLTWGAASVVWNALNGRGFACTNVIYAYWPWGGQRGAALFPLTARFERAVNGHTLG